MKSRLRRILINPLAFFEIMQQDTVWRVVNGIPAKADLRGFTIDPHTMNLVLFVTHESFDEVDVTNDVAPLLTLAIRKVK